MNLRPIGDQLIVTPEKPKEFRGSIILPARHRREPYHTAQVHAVGNAVREVVEPGDRILVEGVVTGAPLPDSEKFVIREEHIIAVIGKETEIE